MPTEKQPKEVSMRELYAMRAAAQVQLETIERVIARQKRLRRSPNVD